MLSAPLHLTPALDSASPFLVSPQEAQGAEITTRSRVTASLPDNQEPLSPALYGKFHSQSNHGFATLYPNDNLKLYISTISIHAYYCTYILQHEIATK